MISNVPDVVQDRIEILILARLSTYVKPPGEAVLAQRLHLYSPTTFGGVQWRDLVSHALRGLQDLQFVTAECQLVNSDELKRRIGPYAAKKWEQWADRVLPGLALGVRADDTKSHTRLARSGSWTAAIVGRVLHLWADGPPPSPASMCDALAWRELGLDGVPQQCPVKIRAHFLRKHIADPGQPDRLIRLLAAQAVESPSPELDAIRAGLVRRWLTGRELNASAPRERSLVDAVHSVAHQARDGGVGDRKVFISTVWQALRSIPPWSALELDDFKAQLVAAHRKRELVLARADLVAAMDPALVAASETRTDGATFHFIVREPV